MAVPPDPVLRAAVRWLSKLPDAGPNRCRAVFAHVNAFSDLTPTQYETAFSWLRETGLLDDLHSDSPVEQRVLEAALRYSQAPWLADADLLIQTPDELPEDTLGAAESLGLSKELAFERLQAAWGKFDNEQRLRIGGAGESALVGILRESVDARVEHVAADSDHYGYDISVHARTHRLHIEVKSTTRRNRTAVYLSRNEFETMRSDPAWQLVVVRLDEHLAPHSIASIPTQWIADHAPHDPAASGRWESCRLDIPPGQAEPGISRLATLFNDEASPLLEGFTSR